tara:strand:- start:216 stop:428 length:213 start_codon:yes stop_codon:yes gene_type:complete
MISLYNATMAHFKAVELESVAKLEILFNKPVGISEHTDFISEIKDTCQKLAEARECMAVLKDVVKQPQEE